MDGLTEARVRAGAAWLDETWLGWWRRVDADRIEADSVTDDVAGQLFGDSNEAFADLFGGDADQWIARGFDHGQKWTRPEGYATFARRVDAEYAALTLMWRMVVRERQAADARKKTTT